MKKNTYVENGVTLSKVLVKAGEAVELKYNGLLKNAGASDVKVHLGYNGDWECSETLEMARTEDGFIVPILLKKAGTLHCAFVDPVGNWDNNSGANYSFKVSAPKAEKVSESVKETEGKKTSRKKKEAVAPEKSKAEKAPKKSRSSKAFEEAAASATDDIKKPKTKRASKATKESSK